MKELRSSMTAFSEPIQTFKELHGDRWSCHFYLSGSHDVLGELVFKMLLQTACLSHKTQNVHCLAATWDTPWIHPVTQCGHDLHARCRKRS